MLIHPRIAVTLLAISLLAQCRTNSQSGVLDADFKEVPLSEYKFEKASVDPGTSLSILAFSGGKSGDKKNRYYSQFIVRNTVSGDTLRILSALIGVDSIPGSASEVYTMPDQFDGKAGVLQAVFETPSDNQNLLLTLSSGLPAGGADPKELDRVLADSANIREYVLINKNADIFEKKFKTVVGVLRFHQQPW